MKTKLWLAISLALNAVVVAALVAVALRAARPSTTETAPAAPAPAKAAGLDLARVPVSKADAADPGRTAANWVQTLRSAGVSEKLVSDVAAADFEDRWQKRMRDAQKQFNLGNLDEAAMEEFYARHDAEQEKELRASLGEEGFRRWDHDRILREFDPALELSEAESESIYQLRKNLDRQRQELDASRRKGDASEMDIENQSEASAAQYDQQLKALLGDERYAMIPGPNTDPGLGELRRSLKSMKASDTQLDAMVKAQQQWNDQRAKLEKQLQGGELAAPDYERQIKAIEAARDQQFQSVLGADGYAEYQREQDSRYRTMKRFSSAWGLSDSDINSLYGTIQSYEHSVQDFQQRAQAIEEQGQQVDWPAVQQALKDYSHQTEELLKKTLGEERYNKIRKHNVVALEQ